MAKFGKIARDKQAWFRDNSVTISASGRSPSDSKGQRNPHLLAIGCEEENLYPSLRGGAAQKFFASRGIKWWRSGRSGDRPSWNGPTRNLASSQLCCVNFLLPLHGIQGALEALLRLIDDDVVSVMPLAYNGLCSRVEFEWIGLSGSLEGKPSTRGANVTSTDAFMVGITDQGTLRAYLFEWKYCEDYSDKNEWLGNGVSGNTRRSRYSALYAAADSPFNGSIRLDDLLYEPIYQIMRLHLLGAKLVRDKEFGVSEARVTVVCPQGNAPYRDAITSPQLAAMMPSGSTLEQAVKSLLKNPDRFSIISQEYLVSALRRAGLGSGFQDWSDYHSERYDW